MKPNDNPLEQYLHDLKLRNFSERTLKTRRFVLHQFEDWVMRQGVDSLLGVDKSTLNEFRNYLHKRKSRKGNGKTLTVTYQAEILRSVRSMYSFLFRVGMIPVNPAATLQLPIRPKTFKGYLPTDEDIEKLLSAPDTDTTIGIRDRAIFQLFLSTGMRVSELRNLKLPDIHLANPAFLTVVKGKGNRSRVIPLLSEVCTVLKLYLNVRALFLNASDSEYLFLSKKGNCLGANTVQEMVKRYCAEVGIPKKFSTHSFRKYLATELIRSNANPAAVQQILGHSSLETLSSYVKLAEDDLRKTLVDCHPRA